ncbi:hypothetical protein GYB59_00515 [bacterium]|nr:hypothetical protein [bacterium]
MINDPAVGRINSQTPFAYELVIPELTPATDVSIPYVPCVSHCPLFIGVWKIEPFASLGSECYFRTHYSFATGEADVNCQYVHMLLEIYDPQGGETVLDIGVSIDRYEDDPGGRVITPGGPWRRAARYNVIRTDTGAYGYDPLDCMRITLNRQNPTYDSAPLGVDTLGCTGWPDTLTLTEWIDE